ncbi:hypothetical protein HMI55_001673, partial [Coelomomyces lativittatus]
MGPKPNMTTTTTPTTTTFLEGACQCYNVHFLVHGFNQEKEGLSSSSSSSSSSNFFIQDGPFSGYPLPLVHESLHINFVTFTSILDLEDCQLKWLQCHYCNMIVYGVFNEKEDQTYLESSTSTSFQRLPPPSPPQVLLPSDQRIVVTNDVL